MYKRGTLVQLDLMEEECMAKGLPAAWERMDAVWDNTGFCHKLYFQLCWLQSERVFCIMEFAFFFFLYKATTWTTL